MITQIAQAIVDWIKSLFATIKMNELETDLKNKKEVASDKIKKATASYNEFMHDFLDFEEYVESQSLQQLSDAGEKVRATTGPSTTGTSGTATSNRSRPVRSRSKRSRNRRAKKAARARKG